MESIQNTLSACYSITKGVVSNMSNYSSVNKFPQATEVKRVDPSIIVKHLGGSPWIKIAAISGAFAVAIGAYGAHGLKLTPEKRAIFETANKYHFYHSLALLAMPIVKRPTLVGSLFLSGVIIFSGTCYLDAIKNNTGITRFTPIGGFMFILGWLTLLF